MGERGPKPKRKVKIEWSPNFAYAIGLLATDGCVSADGRHISFVSKDIEQVNNFMKCLQIHVKIGKNISGYDGNSTHKIQFGDVIFSSFLFDIGITSAKSKTIGVIKVPKKYFFDYLRGCFDGDGTIYSYWDKRWKSSFMFYVSIASASERHIEWLRSRINEKVGSKGHVTKDGKGSTFQLKYAKNESLRILKKMYYSKNIVYLSRKKLKIDKILAIVGKSL
jgi:hypothetical protein